MTEPSRAGRQAEPGDRVLLRGVVESVHDGFVTVRVDDAAPHAIPQRYDLVAVRRAAPEPGPGASRREYVPIRGGNGSGTDTPTVGGGGGGSGSLRIRWHVDERRGHAGPGSQAG